MELKPEQILTYAHKKIIKTHEGRRESKKMPSKQKENRTLLNHTHTKKTSLNEATITKTHTKKLLKH